MEGGVGVLPTVKQHRRMMANNSTFIPKITPFDGDSSMVTFFFDQVKEIANVNQWDRQKTILFLKSNLIGTALQYFIHSDCANVGKSLEDIRKSFSEYFTDNSPHVSILDLASFKMRPGESVKALAHRLETLINRIYPNVPDKESLRQIKRIHLIQALPSHIRIRLLEENILSFEETVNRGQELFAIHATSQDETGVHVSKLDELSKQVNFIAEKINLIKAHDEKQMQGSYFNHRTTKNKTNGSQSKNINKSPTFHRHMPRNCEFQKPQFPSNRYHNSHNDSRFHHRWYHKSRDSRQDFQPDQRHRSYRTSRHFPQRCSFCGRNGHIMSQCFAFKRRLNYQQNRNQTTSDLNPEAYTFRPALNEPRN